jgi:hypothetical protein
MDLPNRRVVSVVGLEEQLGGLKIPYGVIHPDRSESSLIESSISVPSFPQFEKSQFGETNFNLYYFN